MGWYHSHPFDVETFSHCHLSATDVTTQLGWQRAEDRNGNPWLGIVVDPLRSLAKGRPEMGAFRAFPPEYTGNADETPDGKIVKDDAARVERWGVCWGRYHELEIEYFMSSLSENVLSVLSKKFLWMTNLSSTPTLEKEYRDRFSERVATSNDKLKACVKNVDSGLKEMTAVRDGASKDENALEKCAQSYSELGIEQCQTQTAQIAKSLLFCSSLSATPQAESDDVAMKE
jgi:COP9 signalosome complex subunit 5